MKCTAFAVMTVVIYLCNLSVMHKPFRCIKPMREQLYVSNVRTIIIQQRRTKQKRHKRSGVMIAGDSY